MDFFFFWKITAFFIAELNDFMLNDVLGIYIMHR